MRSGVGWFHPRYTINNTTVINKVNNFNVGGGFCGGGLFAMSLFSMLPLVATSIYSIVNAARRHAPATTPTQTTQPENKFSGLERRFGDDYEFSEKDGKYVARKRGGTDEITSDSLTGLYDELLKIDKKEDAVVAEEETVEEETTEEEETEEPVRGQERRPATTVKRNPITDMSKLEDGQEFVLHDNSEKTLDIKGSVSDIERDGDKVTAFCVTTAQGNKYKVKLQQNGRYECITENDNEISGRHQYKFNPETGRLEQDKFQTGYGVGSAVEADAQKRGAQPQTVKIEFNLNNLKITDFIKGTASVTVNGKTYTATCEGKEFKSDNEARRCLAQDIRAQLEKDGLTNITMTNETQGMHFYDAPAQKDNAQDQKLTNEQIFKNNNGDKTEHYDVKIEFHIHTNRANLGSASIVLPDGTKLSATTGPSYTLQRAMEDLAAKIKAQVPKDWTSITLVNENFSFAWDE